MGRKILVEKDIEEGKRLIEALDKANFGVKAALWFYLTDSDEWRLIIASPYEEENGPKMAYSFIQREQKKLTPPIDIFLKDISVLSPNNDLINLLKVAIRTGPGISGIRFTRNVINNILIEDAHIYRMQ